MKKFLLSIFCMLSIMNYAYADEAKFDFTAPSGLTPSITDDMYSDGGNGALAFNTDETTFTNNGVTLNTTKGSSTDSRIWKSAKGVYDLRVYKTATMTIAAPEGGVITAIAFDGSTVNSFSANNGTVDGKNWTGSASSVVFTWADDAKTQKINTITVTFSTDGSVTPDPEEPEGGEGEGDTEVTYTTIAEVIAASEGEAATKGTVVATYARGFLLNDGTGSILVYLGSDKGFVAGDAVTVSGKTNVYGGLLQFGNTAVVEKTGTATVEHPTATVMDGAAMDAYLAAPAIQYVEYTGTLTISDKGYYNVAVDGAATAVGSIQYPQDAIKANLTSGSVVKVTGYTIGVSSSKYVNTMVVKVETVDNGGNEGEGEGGETPEEPETPSNDYLNETFATDLGSFTTQETVGSYPWVFAANYGAKASGYADGASQNAESWLISPAMDLTGETKASIAFDYVINKGDVNAAATNHKLLITSNYTGDVTTTEWTEIEYGAVNNGNWTFNNTGNIALPESMMDKPAVVIAFKYVSTTENSSTWEIKNVVVSGEKGATVEPEEPETPSSDYLNETFATEFGVFTTQETVGNYPWIIDYSTAKVTSYVDGANNAATSWLISTPVDFTNETEAYAAFEYIIRYAESGKVAENHQLLISADYAGDAANATWTDLPYGAVEGSDWTTFYKAEVNVPAEFLGKNGVVFALCYTATTKAGTWEVRNFKVAQGKVAEPEEPEAPAETKEYTVTEALAAYVDGQQIPAIITGYIVGTIDGQVYTDGCRFSGTAETATNLLIADNAAETNPANCMPVQLPKGDVRTALNLVDNPANYKKMVTLTGSLEKYFGVAGLKNVSNYVLDTTTPGEGEGGETPEEPETPSNDYLNETFATDLGSFTTQETVGSYPWVFAANYGAKASGYADGASQNAESWLISPAMDLTGETKASISFDYVINKGDVNAAATNHKLLITSNYTGDVTTTEWTEVEYGAVNNGNWTFNNTGNIALPESMMDKPAVVIAFKYVSTTENSSTWEIKNVVVSGEKGATVEPEEPEGGEDEELEVTDISDIIAAGEGKAKAQGTIIATYACGFLLDDGTGSILVYLGSDNGNVAGEIVTVEGETSMYGGLLQFAQGSVVEVLTTGTVEYPTATVMDGAALDAYLAAPAIQYVEYTGTLTINGNYYNVAVDGAAKATASIQYPHDAIKANLTSGSVVKVTGYTIGVSGSKYVNTMAVKVETVSEPEAPAETEEYTVTEALAAFVDGKQIPAIITGYIVGTIDGKTYTEGCHFSGTAETATNLLIADNAEETDPANCIPVQLPKGDVRTALNLVDNSGNYKKQVKLTGSLEKYFGVAGLKNVTAYEFTGATGIEKVEIRNEKSEIYDLTGRRVENITAPGIYIVGGKKVLVR